MLSVVGSADLNDSDSESLAHSIHSIRWDSFNSLGFVHKCLEQNNQSAM
jgi:hypothetical protein